MVSRPQYTHLDDDDVYTPDHIEVLLDFARETNSEFVYGKARVEKTPGEWIQVGGPEYPHGHYPYGPNEIPHSAVMFRSYIRLFSPRPDAWKFSTADHFRWIRVKRAGVRVGFLDRVVTEVPLRPGENSITAARFEKDKD